METYSEHYKSYLIEVVHPYAGMWQANIYPESAKVRSVNPALPTIQCKTKEEALAEARKRIDEIR